VVCYHLEAVLAILLALGTAISWGTNPLFARRAMLKVDVLGANFYGILAGLFVITAYSFFSGEMTALPTLRLDQFLTFALLGIVTIALGRTFYYVSITKIGAGPSISIVAASILVAPTIALFVLNELINLKMATGIVMVFAGVYFIAMRGE